MTRRDDEHDLAQLLQAVGRRPPPPPDATEAVRAAVEGEWRAATRRPVRGTRRAAWALAAGIAAAALGIAVLVGRSGPGAPVELVARIERVNGTAEYRQSAGSGWQALVAGVELRRGVQVRTGDAARVAVKLAGGLDLRLDSRARLALHDSSHVELVAGAVYLDAGVTGPATHVPLEIATPYGNVSHLGTQYEARLGQDDLTVSVREGHVAVERRSGRITGAAGERLVIGDSGVERTAVSADDADWAWTGEIAPGFAIEGRSLQEFLAWAGRESGRTVVYANGRAADTARSLVLHGSVDKLTPSQALSAVLATTDLDASIETGRIVIDAGQR